MKKALQSLGLFSTYKGKGLFLALFASLSLLSSVNTYSQDYLVDYARMRVETVGYDCWCCDGFCLDVGVRCCDLAPGCVPNPVEFATGGPGGGMDPRWRLGVHGYQDGSYIDPCTGTNIAGGWGGWPVYSLNNIGGSGSCGGGSYTGTYNNPDFFATIYSASLDQLRVNMYAWEEDACGSQTTYSTSCALFYDDDELREGNWYYNINSFTDSEVGNQHMDLTVYEWWGDIEWHIANAPSAATTVYLCSNVAGSLDVTSALDANGDFALSTNTTTYNSIVSRVENDASNLTIPAGTVFPRTYYLFEINDCASNNNDWSRGAYTTITVQQYNAPVLGTLSVSSSCWAANNNNTYTITLPVTIPANGYGIDRVHTLINYQDGCGLAGMGYFGADNDGHIWSADQFTHGGYYASKCNNCWGYQYITLVGFTTTVSGSTRYFNWTVRPDTDFNESLCNDISKWASNECGRNTGWVNQDLDFDSYRSPLATASVNNSTICDYNSPVTATFTLGNPSPGSFVRWQYQWNGTGGAWNNWGTTNPYSWTPQSSVGSTLYVRAQSTYGTCTEYSNIVSTTINTDNTAPSITAPANQTLYSNPNNTNSCAGALILSDPGFSESGTCSGTASGTENILPSSGLVLWTKADAGVKLVGSNVIQWSDISGNGNHFTSPASGNRPTVVSNAINGHPVLRFNTAQYMWNSQNFSNPYTILTIAKMNNGTDRRLISSTQNWLMGHWSGSQDVMYASGWVGGVSSGATPDNLTHMYGATCNGTTTTFYDYGSQIRASNVNLNIGQLRLNGYGTGSSETSDCDVAEVIVYNRVLSASERQKVEGYLAYKYNLQVPLATMEESQSFAIGSNTANYLAADNTGNRSTTTSTVTVNTYPGPTVTPSASTICETGNLTLTASDLAPSGDVLNCTGNNYLNVSSVPIGSNWTIETWFQYPFPSGSWNTMIRGTAYHHIIVNRTSWELGTYVSGFRTSGFNMTQLSNGWHHMTAVGTGGSTAFYIDGVKVGVATGYQATDNIVAVGNYQGGNQPFGKIDEVRIWNTALNHKEINNWMTQEVTSSHPNWGNMVAYYKLNGNGNNSRSGSYNGTTGAPYVAADHYTYVWSGPGGVSFTNNNSTVESTVASNLSSGNYNVYATVNGCNSTTTATAITAHISPTGTTVPNYTVVCEGQVVNFTTSGLSGGETFVRYQYNWENQGSTEPTTGWVNWSTSASYNWTSSNGGGTHLWVRTELSNGSCTGFFTSGVAVNITDDITISSSGGGTICSGGNLTLSSTTAGGGGTCSYQWQVSSSGGGGPFSNIGGATSSTYNTGALTASRWYRVARTCTGAGCGTITSNVQTVTVVADPTISASGATTICSGGNATVSSSASGGTGTCTYQWQISSTGSGSGFGNIGGATSSTYNTGALTGTRWYRIVRSCTGNGCANPTSNSVEITVVADPTISASGAATLCSGGSTTISSSTSGGTGTCTYQWQLSTTGSGSGFASIGGATGSSYNTLGLTVTTWFRVIRSCTGNGCANPTSNAVQITIVADPTISTSGGGTICTGGNLTVSFTSGGGTGTCGNQWQVSTAGSGGPFSNIGGATSSTYNTGALTSTQWYRAVRTCTGTGCGTVNSNVQTVTVVLDPTITASGATSICTGGTATLSSVASFGTGTCSYQWQMSTTGGGAGFGNIGGATSSGYTTPVLTADRWYRVVRSCTGSGCGTATSNEVAVTVEADPTIAIAGGTSICTGGTASLTSSETGGAGTCTYQWQLSTTGAGSGFGNISGATGSSYNTTAATVDSWYRLIRTCDGTGCSTPTSNVEFVEVVSPNMAATFTKSPDVAGVCQGTNVSASATAGSGGGAGTYDEYRYSTNGGFTWNTYVPGTAIATGSLNGDNIVQIETRRISPSSSDNCADIDWTNTVFWTVDNAHIPASITFATPDPVCSGANLTVSTNASAGTNGTVDWYDGPAGTGNYIGTSTITIDNPTVDLTYYAWIHGSACPDVQSSVAVDVRSPADNLVLPSATSHPNLVEQCTVNGWTYYANAATPDDWIFSIRKNSQSTPPTFDVDLDAAAAVIQSTYTASYPQHGSFLMRRYWNVGLTSGSIANGIDVRFYYDDADLVAARAARDAFRALYPINPDAQWPQWFKTNASGGGFAPTLITGATASGNSWFFSRDLLVATGDDEQGIRYIEFPGLTSLSGGTGGFSAGQGSPLLPVELMSFTATAGEDDITLDWLTASEVNNERFEVYKSADGVTFNYIGEVAGNGTTNEAHSYAFVDENVDKNVLHYYRLKQVDLDGTSENSNIVSAIISTDSRMVIGNLIPNPASYQSYIEVISPNDTQFDYIVTNVIGEEVMSKSVDINAGAQRLYFDVDQLVPGNYLISIFSENGMQAVRKLQVIK